jgi:hypothetical protein
MSVVNINVTAIGTTTLIPGMPGINIIVTRIFLSATGNVNVTFQGHIDGKINPVLGPNAITNGVPFILPELIDTIVRSPVPPQFTNAYMIIPAGASLELVTDQSQRVAGQIAYFTFGNPNNQS